MVYMNAAKENCWHGWCVNGPLDDTLVNAKVMTRGEWPRRISMNGMKCSSVMGRNNQAGQVRDWLEDRGVESLRDRPWCPSRWRGVM